MTPLDDAVHGYAMAGSGVLQQQATSSRRRAFILLALSLVVGLVPAVMLANAFAKGGAVWTGGGIVAGLLLLAAVRSNLAANHAEKALAAANGQGVRRFPVFTLAVLACLILVAGVSWVVWDRQAGVQVGSCLRENSSGEIATVDCSSPYAMWRVSAQVADPSDCPVPNSGQVNYVTSGQSNYCLELNPFVPSN